jgi:hypothetical protein
VVTPERVALIDSSTYKTGVFKFEFGVGVVFVFGIWVACVLFALLYCYIFKL